MSLSDVGSWASIIGIPLTILIAFWSGSVYSHFKKTIKKQSQKQDNKKGNAIQVGGDLEKSDIKQSIKDISESD